MNKQERDALDLQRRRRQLAAFLGIDVARIDDAAETHKGDQDERDFDILQRRYAMGRGPEALSSIAEFYDISSGRVAYLCRRAEHRLRKSIFSAQGKRV